LHGGDAMSRLVLVGLRVGLGVIFLWATVTKVPDMAAFAQDVANYRILSPVLVPYAAAAVVGIEIVTGIALVTGVVARPAALLAAALLVAFTGFVAQALLRGIDLRCGCFGGDERASWWTIGRDLLMLAAAIAVATAGERHPRRNPPLAV